MSDSLTIKEPQKPKDNQTTSVLSEPTTSISTVYVHLILDVPLGLIQRIEKLYFYNNTNQLNEFIGMLIDCKVRSLISFYFFFELTALIMFCFTPNKGRKKTQIQ